MKTIKLKSNSQNNLLSEISDYFLLKSNIIVSITFLFDGNASINASHIAVIVIQEND